MVRGELVIRSLTVALEIELVAPFEPPLDWVVVTHAAPFDDCLALSAARRASFKSLDIFVLSERWSIRSTPEH